MTDTPTQQGWVIPADPTDLAPLPVLMHGDNFFSDYNRQKREFGGVYEHLLLQSYPTFEECRAAMIDARIEALGHFRSHTRLLANTIEHLRFIPATPFPSDVTREVPEAERQEAEGEEKAAEEVKPAKTDLRRPRRS